MRFTQIILTAFLIGGVAHGVELGQGVTLTPRGSWWTAKPCLEPMAVEPQPLSRAYVGSPAAESIALVHRDLRESRPLSEEPSLPVSAFIASSTADSETVHNVVYSPVRFELLSETIATGERGRVQESIRDRFLSAGEWRWNCGERVVVSRRLGADLHIGVHLRVRGQSAERCRADLEAQLSLGTPGPLWADPNWLFGPSRSPHCRDSQVTISLLQRGGSIDGLPSEFSTRYREPNRIYASLTCSAQDPGPCAGLGRALQLYVYGASGFRANVDASRRFGTTGGLDVLGFTVAPYSVLGVYPLSLDDR